MSKLDRRDFLKLVGAGGVGAGAGWMLAESVKHPVEHLIPYPVPPEEYSPGIATWYNTVCNMCQAGCGITVRTREGRAKKIEGNKAHPVNQGRLCALGQAGLQVLYNPDRITRPLLQQDERGSIGFVQTTWDDALSAAVVAIEENGGESVAFLSRGVSGHLAQLLDTFASELGGRLLHYDYAHEHALYAATERLFGRAILPYYDIGNAHYVLSFGADYLNNWLSPVHNALGFGRSRQEGTHRGHFVQVEPKMTISGAAADEWIPANPGTEGILALGIANRLVATGVYSGTDAGDWAGALEAYAADSVSARTGVAADTIVQLADAFTHGPGLAIGGGATAGHSNGVDALVAVNALNYLVGNIGNEGGVVLNPDPAVTASIDHARLDTMQALTEDARSGRVGVLIVNDTNPLFSLPSALGFGDALESIPVIISLSSFMDETTAQADIVLPSHTYLESWGDVLPDPGVGFTVGAVSQPVVSPLYDTQGTGDTVLALAARLGMSDALPWNTMRDCLMDGWREIYERAEAGGNDFDGFWRDLLMAGAWGENTRADQAVTVDSSVIGVADPEFTGDGSLHLQPFLSTAMHDGRGANLPWMQELPDPITSVVYGSWVEMNPGTAAELGIRDGDVVSVSSEHGSVEAPVVLFPAIRPDVIAMPIGQGHDRYGRYAEKRGANPISILAPASDGGGGLAANATRVSVTSTGRRAPAVRTGGVSRQLGRNIVQTTGGSDAHVKLNSIPVVVEPA